MSVIAASICCPRDLAMQWDQIKNWRAHVGKGEIKLSLTDIVCLENLRKADEKLLEMILVHQESTEKYQ